MLVEEAITSGLSDLEHEVLTDFLSGQSSLPDLLKKRGLTAGDFLAWLESPAIAAAIDDYLRLHDLHLQAQVTRLRRAALDALHEVSAATPNLTEKRKAATTVLTHIDRLWRSHPHLSPFPPPSPPARGPSAGRSPGGGGEGSFSYPSSTPRAPHATASNGAHSLPGATAWPAATAPTRSTPPSAGKPCEESYVGAPQPEGLNVRNRRPIPSDPEGVVVAPDDRMTSTRVSSRFEESPARRAPVDREDFFPFRMDRTSPHPPHSTTRQPDISTHRRTPASLAARAGLVPNTS